MRRDPLILSQGPSLSRAHIEGRSFDTPLRRCSAATQDERFVEMARMTCPRLFDLTDKVAIVTGSSRGIGLAIAAAMAEHGAKVVISSRKQDACDEVAHAINAQHGDERAIAVAANISSKDDLQNLVDQTRKAFGRD